MLTPGELQRRLADINDHVEVVGKKYVPTDDLSILAYALHDLIGVVRELVPIAERAAAEVGTLR
jgi:hypothetical protein